MKRIEHTMAAAAVHPTPPHRRAVATTRCPSIVGCMLAATALLCSVQVGAVDTTAQTNLAQWQLRRLYTPTERELAHGGMATVYLARDLRHERRVAIKVLRDLAPKLKEKGIEVPI